MAAAMAWAHSFPTTAVFPNWPVWGREASPNCPVWGREAFLYLPVLGREGVDALCSGVSLLSGLANITVSSGSCLGESNIVLRVLGVVRAAPVDSAGIGVEGFFKALCAGWGIGVETRFLGVAMVSPGAGRLWRRVHSSGKLGDCGDPVAAAGPGDAEVAAVPS